MASKIYEFFGYPAAVSSPEAKIFRSSHQCPFVDGECIKHIQLDEKRRVSGVCSIKPTTFYKGHVLRREPKCTKGLFFISPTPVYSRIRERLGGDLDEIHPSSGSLTFMHYALGPTDKNDRYSLQQTGVFTTTVDQVALAFTSPKDLPPARSYEHAIEAALGA